jgi:hypothetical protein
VSAATRAQSSLQLRNLQHKVLQNARRSGGRPGTVRLVPRARAQRRW